MWEALSSGGTHLLPVETWRQGNPQVAALGLKGHRGQPPASLPWWQWPGSVFLEHFCCFCFETGSCISYVLDLQACVGIPDALATSCLCAPGAM